jgi:hypothetical protein
VEPAQPVAAAALRNAALCRTSFAYSLYGIPTHRNETGPDPRFCLTALNS